ncbi:YcxB family protein [Dasania sp. GY-MA-18]|uniref:YcxB family protein n=1 Tax=Dasania phycosphaerae TaxID=2950436 RepID=A0A9J6RNQ3_9GAMM|nr:MULTISPECIES: YcxB family protein [Dasania]MCR8923205.1 YcxB family protein [Dasania sp. GY-MA-18]MCZ0865637.1 YcxB family protein [Dasania phycosphaerae]MCZ0869362.1 YcxB family protein [Dasania phycosphaerae]
MPEQTSADNSNSPSHSSYYILNRDYFSECFDESANTSLGIRAYYKAIVLLLIAVGLFFMAVSAYIAWFMLALAVVEVFSVRYRRGWWVARQMLGRASGSKVNLRLDAQGISTDSQHHQQCIAWGDISELRETERGFVISHKSGRSYLSKSGLDVAALDFLRARCL